MQLGGQLRLVRPPASAGLAIWDALSTGGGGCGWTRVALGTLRAEGAELQPQTGLGCSAWAVRGRREAALGQACPRPSMWLLKAQTPCGDTAALRATRIWEVGLLVPVLALPHPGPRLWFHQVTHLGPQSPLCKIGR